jgi:DNA ligase-1
MKRGLPGPQTPVKQAKLSSFFTSPSSPSSKRARQISNHNEEVSAAVELFNGNITKPPEETDEDLARRLQEEWNSEHDQANASTSLLKEELVTKPVKEEVLLNPFEAFASASTRPIKENADINVNLELLDTAIAGIDLGTDVFVFDPDQVSVDQWPTKLNANKETVPTTPYALLAHAFALLSSTRSRLAIVTILTNLLRVLLRHDPEALLPTVYLVSNHIAPPYDGVELGLGGSIVNRAIRDVTGKSASQLRVLYNKTGDPGDVAYEAKKDIKTLMGNRRPIEVMKLFSILHQIAGISGSGSSSAKLSHITKLLVASRGEETRFLVRTFVSHLRINAVRTTITSALARVFSLDGPGSDERLMVTKSDRRGLLANPSKAKEKADPRRLELMEKLARCEKLVREVRARHPNFSSIVPVLLEHGLERLSELVPLRVGTPLSPMLGSITRSLPAMHTKLGSRAFVCEFKYDGQRAQIHAIRVPRNHPESSALRKTLRGGQGQWVGPQEDIYVRLFSRHLEDMSSKYPDVNNMIPLLMEAKQVEGDEEQQVQSFIMDAEVVALSLEGDLLPFQTLTNRSRKDVELNQVKVRVGIFAFDLMYLNGKSLLKTAFRKRRSLLYRMLPPLEPQDARIARFAHVKSLESNQVDDVEEFFNLARTSKCEG